MPARPPVILALDLGTTEVKGALVDPEGRLAAGARVPHTLDVNGPAGRAEQDPEAWWRGIVSVVRELMAASPGELACICCVGQGPTMVPVDEAGRATHPALTWMDARDAEEAAELSQATGLSGLGLGILPAARWLERHAAGAAGATRWYLNAWEWAALRMCGTAATTRSFGQVLPDPARAARAGLEIGRLAPESDAGAPVGLLSPEAAHELGIRPGVPVVAGTVDSFASFHGAGLAEAGQAIDTGGTSGGLAVYWDRPLDIPGTWVAAAPLPGRWYAGGAMTATGKALDWLDEAVLAGGPGLESLIDEAAGVAPGAGGLLFLPYLAGERSPLWDPRARGAFIGLTLAHGRRHLSRAVLEAAAMALRHVAAPILAAGVRIDELRVTGGTARGDTWNQVKADVLGVEVAVPEVRDAAVLGAAILAAPAAGWVPDTRIAIERMVRIDHRLAPNAAFRAIYDALFAAYVAAWPAIEPTVRVLRDLPPPG